MTDNFSQTKITLISSAYLPELFKKIIILFVKFQFHFLFSSLSIILLFSWYRYLSYWKYFMTTRKILMLNWLLLRSFSFTLFCILLLPDVKYGRERKVLAIGIKMNKLLNYFLTFSCKSKLVPESNQYVWKEIWIN